MLDHEILPNQRNACQVTTSGDQASKTDPHHKQRIE